MKTYQTHLIREEHMGLTVEEYLKTILSYSGRKLQKLTRAKGIRLNKKPVFLQKKLKAGDLLQVLLLEDLSYGALPEEGPVEVLYEDQQIIVLNKPVGLLVHPAGQTQQGTLANYLAHYFQSQQKTLTIRPLHRLDRDTSGCVLFAKDSQSQTSLELQLQDGRMKRTYLALVEGIPDPAEGRIEAPIGPHPTKPNRRALREEGDPAVTEYRTLSTFRLGEPKKESQWAATAALLELQLETGRTHQIRIHLTHIGHPILGDRMYGKASSRIGRQALHAWQLSLEHPSRGEVFTFTAPLPGDMVAIIE